MKKGKSKFVECTKQKSAESIIAIEPGEMDKTQLSLRTLGTIAKMSPKNLGPFLELM